MYHYDGEWKNDMIEGKGSLYIRITNQNQIHDTEQAKGSNDDNLIKIAGEW